jgi:membrane-associated phospholipid phosphatase
MDAIDALDWGVYSHFDFQNQRDPWMRPVIQTGVDVGSYVVIGLVLLAAVVLFLIQRKWRSALIVPASALSAFALIEAVHRLVPRRRPENAVKVLGPDEMLGSYPSASVFLFMLAMILLGFAIWGVMRNGLVRGFYVVAAALLTVWVCMSQFFLALHFLTDILGGMAGAALIGWAAYRFLDEPRPSENGASQDPLSDGRRS